MTDLSSDLFRNAPDTSAISSAILGQESGNNPNVPPSVNGAIGQAQITPGTWQQYAKQGEDINNPDDNLSVHNRILADLSQKANGDPARIAVGYFSGPGNIAPTDSSTPWKADKKDGNGKSVSSYVSDIIGRMNPISDAQASGNNIPKDLSADLFGEGKDLSSDISGQQEPGLIDRLKSDFAKRDIEGEAAADAYVAGKQGLLPTYLDVIGKTSFGKAADVVGETTKSVWQPDPNEPIQAAITKGAQAIANTAPVQAAVSSYNSLSPEMQRHVEAVGDIAQFLPIGKAASTVGDATGAALSKTGEAISNVADAQALARKNDFVKDLITPKITPTVASDQFSRSTEQGILRTRVVEPTPQEQAMIDAVSQLPVSKNKSMLANYNIISNTNEKEANDLISALKTNDVPVNLGDVQDTITNSVNKLRENPYVTGDGESSALKVVNVMNKAILDNAGEDGNITASGLLRARKDFDNTIKQQKGGKIFDPSLDSPTSIAVQNMRQAINDLVESKVPDVGYKASLQKQSNLYRAMDNIEEKGASEPPNLIKRTAQKVTDLVPGKNMITKGLVAGAGMGATAAAPIYTGIGLGTYGAYKAATSPITKKIIGNTLQGAGAILGHKEGGIIKNREIHLSKKLEVKLGRKPKAREIELATYVGANGVHRLLNQKDIKLPAHKMFPEEAVKQKRELFFNKKKPYTVGHIKAALG